MLSIFCGSKLNIYDGYKKPSVELVKTLNTEFKYAFGGGDEGIMGDVARVCIQNGYYTVGVNCLRWKSESDSLLSEVHYFDNIIERQNELIKRGDGYIVLPGGVGTIYEALQCITLNDVKEANKPIFFLNIGNYFMHLFDMLNWGRKMGTITKSNSQLNIIVKDTPEELAKEIRKWFTPL